MGESVYLAIGSNLGDRMVNFAQALALLGPSIHLIRCSSVYETPPWGYLDQPPFLNMVVEVKTELEPMELLTTLKLLEEKIGREKSIRYGPRKIDLDILTYDNVQFQSDHLEIPHPRISERAFVLVPLVELAPKLTITPHGNTTAELLSKVDQHGISVVDPVRFGAPDEVANEFNLFPASAEKFRLMQPSHQREYLLHVYEGRRPATRQRRIKWMINQLKGVEVED